MKATHENTVFVTVAAYPDWKEKTAVFRISAASFGIPVMINDTNEQWQGFYHHKIGAMRVCLNLLKSQGKEFAFILDSRDVVFIDPLDTILDKFNNLHSGRVIFNQDIWHLWPRSVNDLDGYVAELKRVTGDPNPWLNAGCLAGDIDRILVLMECAADIRQGWTSGKPRDGMATRVYRHFPCGQYTNNDQVLYQLCQMYYPELIQLDRNKDLFAIVNAFPNLNEHCECPANPRYDKVINNAGIVHAPALSKPDVPAGQDRKLGVHGYAAKWREWAFSKKWRT